MKNWYPSFYEIHKMEIYFNIIPILEERRITLE